MKKKILILIILLIVAAGGFFLFKKLEPQNSEDFIMLFGNVEVTEVNPGFKLTGKIIKLFTDEGCMVDAGQKIAILENADLKAIVRQTAHQLQEAQTRHRDLKAGSRPQEIREAEANVSSAKADLVKAEKDYERTEFLYKNGAVSAQELDAAKKAYDVAVAQHKAMLEKLSLVKEGPRIDEIIAAEQMAKQARAALSVSNERLKDTVLYSPIKGVILKKNVEAGDVVLAGTPVFTMGDLSKPYIKVYVKEDKLGLVKLGQKAEVAVDTYPGKIYEGTVSYISNEAEFTPKNIQTKEERVKWVFEVKVNVKNENNELKPGMPADVKLLLK